MLSSICGPGRVRVAGYVPTGPLTSSVDASALARVGRDRRTAAARAASRRSGSRPAADRTTTSSRSRSRAGCCGSQAPSSGRWKFVTPLAWLSSSSWAALPACAVTSTSSNAELVADLPVRLLVLGLRNAEHPDAVELAVREPGLLDRVAGALLRPAVEVDLLADGSVSVVEADDRRSRRCPCPGARRRSRTRCSRATASARSCRRWRRRGRTAAPACRLPPRSGRAGR